MTEPWSLPAEIRARVMVTPTCWLWTGQITRDGYGVLSIGGTRGEGRRDLKVHRVAYEAAIGLVPAGLVLDHVCHDPAACIGGRTCIHRRCLRPDHLRAVAAGANSSRNTWAARTHCAHGHPLTDENVYQSPNSGRLCRACRRIAAARDRAHKSGHPVPPSEVRAWAASMGFDVTPRAVLRLNVIQAWNAAHPDRPFTLPKSQRYVVSASEVREWAKANGFRVDPRGRLPLDVIEAWDLAHPGNRFGSAEKTGEDGSG